MSENHQKNNQQTKMTQLLFLDVELLVNLISSKQN